MTDDDIIDVILKNEGGYTNNPHDCGGPTNFGITAAEYGAWLNKGAPATPDEVKAMDQATARAIYKKKYIEEPRFDQVADPNLKMVLVDSGVLFGVNRATVWLQLALGMARPDGKFGSTTAQALQACIAQRMLPKLVLGHRLQAIAEIVKNKPDQIIFLRGWINRAASLLEYV
jgi:lysozyme family protein